MQVQKNNFLFSIKYHSLKTLEICQIFKKIIEINYNLLINFWLLTFLSAFPNNFFLSFGLVTSNLSWIFLKLIQSKYIPVLI